MTSQKGNFSTPAGKTTLPSGLIIGVPEVFRCLRCTKPKASHHRSPGGERLGRESARRSSLKGRERVIVSQIKLERTREGHRESDKTGTVSKAALDRLLRDGVEASEAFPNAYIPS